MGDYRVTEINTYDANWLGLEDKALTSLGGCCDPLGKELGLGAWECHVIVMAINDKGETRTFAVVFQPLERTNDLYAYSGYDVVTAGGYGCDADESGQLVEFLNCDNSVIDNLAKLAKKEAKAEYDTLMQNRSAA